MYLYTNLRHSIWCPPGCAWRTWSIYLCMYICPYVYTYTLKKICVVVHIHIRIYVIMSMYLYAYIHENIIYIYMCVYACMYVSMYLCICVCVYMYIYLYIYIYIHIYICLCVQTSMHIICCGGNHWGWVINKNKIYLDRQIRNINTHEEHTGADMWPPPGFRLAAKKRAFANPSLDSKSMFLGS